MTLENTVKKIARRRAMLVLDPESFIYNHTDFGDADKVNKIAEVFGGTYTEAWDLVRAEFKRQIQELA